MNEVQGAEKGKETQGAGKGTGCLKCDMSRASCKFFIISYKFY